MPYFACFRQITSNSTYLEAKQVEIYLPEGRLCLILPVSGKFASLTRAAARIKLGFVPGEAGAGCERRLRYIMACTQKEVKIDTR